MDPPDVVQLKSAPIAILGVCGIDFFMDDLTSKNKQVIALGGGGFSMEPDNLCLDKYILSRARNKNPKVCFVPTASGDSESYIGKFYDSFSKFDCEKFHLSLFSPPSKDLLSFVSDMDIIYVGGGNTKNLLCLWREWELDRYIKAAWENGTILSGLSAGAMCWFEEGLTDSITGTLTRLKCLGWLPGSCCPHFDGEAERRPIFREKIKTGDMLGGYGIDDGVGLHFVDSKLAFIVSSREKARAVLIKKVDGISEQIFQPQLLKQQ